MVTRLIVSQVHILPVASRGYVHASRGHINTSSTYIPTSGMYVPTSGMYIPTDGVAHGASQPMTYGPYYGA